MAEPTQQVTGKRKARIFIVDDHPIVLEGMTKLINQDDSLTVCGVARDVGEALKAIKKLTPDLAVVDFRLGDGDGLVLIRQISASALDVPVLILSMHEESIYAERALRAGAKGYIMKRDATDQLMTGIHRVLAGYVYVSEEITSRLLLQLSTRRPERNSSPLSCLTARELEVFRLIGRGRRTREIAESLRLSVKTIESYRERIKHKLGLESGTELIVNAVRDQDDF